MNRFFFVPTTILLLAGHVQASEIRFACNGYVYLHAPYQQEPGEQPVGTTSTTQISLDLDSMQAQVRGVQNDSHFVNTNFSGKIFRTQTLNRQNIFYVGLNDLYINVSGEITYYGSQPLSQIAPGQSAHMGTQRIESSDQGDWGDYYFDLNCTKVD